MKKWIFLCLLLFICSSMVVAEQAQKEDLSKRDMVKEKAIWQELEKVAPNALTKWQEATEALDKGDFQTSTKLYEEVLKQAPRFNSGLRRLGISYSRIGKRTEGLALLEEASKAERSPENLSTLAQELAFPPKGQTVTVADKERACTLAQIAEEKSDKNDPSYTVLLAELALELGHKQQLCDASKKLIDRRPDYVLSHYFASACATLSEDWVSAEQEMKKAESLGLPHEAAEKALASGISYNATISRCFWYSIYLFVGWIVGLVLLFILGKTFSFLSLRFLETADPNLGTSSKELTLRKIYRIVINIASIYYYISMPIIAATVIVIVAGLVYLMLLIGHIPIKLFAIVVAPGLATIFAIVKSFFIKIKNSEYGRSLTEAEAPGLWQLTREVAKDLGTRPIDEIRITPSTDMAVYEQGNWREKAQDKAKRVLILGIGLLNGFEQDAFRAVLAHEYGHFSNRDTAGGDIALKVRRDMLKFLVAMAIHQQTVWWNIAYLFLRAYNFIFRRISFGATRLQEVLADRVAALTYGAVAFESGLRHVIRCEVEFSYLANQEIENALSTRRSLNNLYELKSTGEKDQELETTINKLITEKTSEDDTHPSPIDRFRYVKRVSSKAVSTTNAMVWDLFADQQAITREMSLLVGKQTGAGDELHKEDNL